MLDTYSNMFDMYEACSMGSTANTHGKHTIYTGLMQGCASGTMVGVPFSNKSEQNQRQRLFCSWSFPLLLRGKQGRNSLSVCCSAS